MASMGNGYVWLPQGFDMTAPRSSRLDETEAIEAEKTLSAEVVQVL